MAKYKRNLLPKSIPKSYVLKPIFDNIADDEEIRSGVVAFRDFLYILFDNLIADGDVYAKPPKKPSSMTDYPFLHYLTNVLVQIGYFGKLSENESLIVSEIPLCGPSIDANGKKQSAKIPAVALMECLRFLATCGFDFGDADLDVRALSISETQPLLVSYPSNDLVLIGLKALAIADVELRNGRAYWNDHNLLRCDYRLLGAEKPDITDVLTDFLHPLPRNVRDFALKLHRHSINAGLICTLSILDDTSFSYAHIKDGGKELSAREKYQKRIWAFSYSVRHGYCLFVRAKRTDKYADAIESFPPYLQGKIADGYGCYRKFGRERCQNDCQGVRLPLDESILEVAKEIETWLDFETPSILLK